jgi:hypothetical protein
MLRSLGIAVVFIVQFERITISSSVRGVFFVVSVLDQTSRDISSVKNIRSLGKIVSLAMKKVKVAVENNVVEGAGK